jgi:hypothetical protein
MSDRKHRNRARVIAILLLSLTLAGTPAVSSAAWAWPGASHHESTHGESFKTFWAKIIEYIKIHFVRPVSGGGNSSPTCS